MTKKTRGALVAINPTSSHLSVEGGVVTLSWTFRDAANAEDAFDALQLGLQVERLIIDLPPLSDEQGSSLQ